MYYVLATIVVVGFVGTLPVNCHPVAQVQGTAGAAPGTQGLGFGFPGFEGAGFGFGAPGAAFPFFGPQGGAGFPGQFPGFPGMGSPYFGQPVGPGGSFSTSGSQSFASSGSFGGGHSGTGSGSSAGASSQSVGHQAQPQPHGVVGTGSSGTAHGQQNNGMVPHIDTSSGAGSSSQHQPNRGHGQQSSSGSGAQSHSFGGNAQGGFSGSGSGAQSTGNSAFGPDGRRTEVNYGNGPDDNFGVRISVDESADGSKKTVESGSWVWNK